MLGKKSIHAQACFDGGFIGTDFSVNEDLTRNLPEEWRDFNKRYIPIYLQSEPSKTKVSAGLACGALWTVSKGIKKGDIVLCPDGSGTYRCGEVVSDYYYATNQILQHRRKVKWLETAIPRASMSEALQNSTGSIGTVCNISDYREEIERFLATKIIASPITTQSAEIEDPATFAMEKHLEEFLVANWSQTILAKEFDIYEENGEQVGRQYSTDTGPIDVLAISKDKKRILVVELKRGRASDVVVGQILRYMGFIKDEIAEVDQEVLGAIIAFEDDKKLQRALSSVSSISFYRYQVSFKLVKSEG